MARPIKKGLDYFNLDVGFLRDIKVRKIMRACGPQSIAILISLLSSIYREEGYYVMWDSDMTFLVADEVGTSEGAVSELVQKACEVGFFDAELFKTEKILTSKRVQENYKLASRQKKDSSIKPEYQLPRVNYTDNGVNHVGNEVNNTGNTQSKTEQSKSDNNKHKNNARVSTPAPPPDSKFRENFTHKIWPLFGKKTKFEPAYQAYYEDLLEGATDDQIIAALKNLAEYYQINGIQQRYMVNPETYFLERRYTDILDLTPPNNQNAAQPFQNHEASQEDVQWSALQGGS